MAYDGYFEIFVKLAGIGPKPPQIPAMRIGAIVRLTPNTRKRLAISFGSWWCLDLCSLTTVVWTSTLGSVDDWTAGAVSFASTQDLLAW